MAKVTNKFYIQAIHDGSSIYAELVNTTGTTLVQTITDKGVVTPNWTTTASTRPVIYPRTKLNGTYKACSGKFYYNDKELTEKTVSGTTYYDYSGSGVTGNDYFFEKTTVTDGGVTWPAVKIIRNLAGVDNNYDNDIIRFDGSTEEGGHAIDFSVSRAIRITRFTGTGNYGLVLGGNALTEEHNTTVVYAQLFDGNSSEAIAPTKYKTKWYREGIDSNPWKSSSSGVSNYTNGAQPAAATQAGITLDENCQYITVGLSDVDDNVILRCVFVDATDDTNILFTAWGKVDDETDGFQMQIRCDSVNYIGAENIQLKDGQTADMKAWMSKNTDIKTEYTGFTKFMCKLYDNHNNLIIDGTTDADSPLYGKSPDTVTTSVTYGYFDVTKSNMSVYSDAAHTSTIITASNGGSLSIKYDFVDRPNDATTGKKGGDGGITGYFLALSESDAS